MDENRPTDPEWAAGLKPGWQDERVRNFTSIISGIPVENDMTQDGWTKTFRLLFNMSGLTPEQIPEAMEINDLKKMEQLFASTSPAESGEVNPRKNPPKGGASR